MLQKKLNGGVATVLVILSILGVLALGFYYVKDPPQISPEETLRMMQNAPAANGGGGGGGAPATSAPTQRTSGGAPPKADAAKKEAEKPAAPK